MSCINTVAVAAVPHWQTARTRHQRDHHSPPQGFPHIREGHLGELADPRHTGWETTPLASSMPPYLHLQLTEKVPLPLELWDSTEMLFFTPLNSHSSRVSCRERSAREWRKYSALSLHSLAVLWDALSSALPKSLLEQGVILGSTGTGQPPVPDPLLAGRAWRGICSYIHTKPFCVAGNSQSCWAWNGQGAAAHWT